MLTDAAARAVRLAYQTALAEGRRPDLKTFANRYGISRCAIYRIGCGKNYKWLEL